MKFEYYNPSDDKRSCVVRTLTKITGKEYSIVKAELAALAQNSSLETCNDERVFGKYMENHNIYKLNNYNDTKVGQLELICGTYCVYCTNRENFYHLLPVIDNVIYDRRDDCRELYVIAVYKKENI